MLVGVRVSGIGLKMATVGLRPCTFLGSRAKSQARTLELQGSEKNEELKKIPKVQVASVAQMGANIKPKKQADKSFRREDIPKAVKRVIIKVGTSVLTRDQEFGVSLTRLASLVEQVSALVHQGKEVIIVTSGAVGFGKMKLQVQTVMSQTVRNTLSWGSNQAPPSLDSRACAAAGQSGLMTLYDAMFSQYGVSIAQILVTMSDFQVDAHRANMCETINELLSLGIVPICNENDVFYSNTESREFVMSHQNTTISSFNPNFKSAHQQRMLEDGHDTYDIKPEHRPTVVRLTANDSLTALLAVQLDAQLMVMLSDVDGIYTAPPLRSFDVRGSSPKLLHTFNPDDPSTEAIEYGRDQRVGRGGMAAKVESAKFALNHGVHCILGNGHHQDVLQKIFEGRSVGTLFTRQTAHQEAPHVRAQEARLASKQLTALQGSERRSILEKIAKNINKQAEVILSANQDDLNNINSANEIKQFRGLGESWQQRAQEPPPMALSKRKLKALSEAIEAIAIQAAHTVYRNTRWIKVSDGLYLEQEAVPMGVALCVFDDTCPDVVAQVAALSLASGNAVLLKGTERSGDKTMAKLHSIFTAALEEHKVSSKACTLIPHREAFEDYLSLSSHLDIVIPRGGRQLLDFVRNNTKIAVLGDAAGLCHVYVHEDAELEMATNIVRDSKCANNSAGFGQYAMQTLLVHASLVEQGHLDLLITPLLKANVTVYGGPRMRALFRSQALKMPPARSLNVEWDVGACAVEVVESLDEAIAHINSHGSHHTDVIVTSDDMAARKFAKGVDSACVFHNASTRFSDSYAFGLGQQVGVETKRGPNRGPVGIEGLMTSKWLLKGKGHVTETLGEVRTGHWTLQKKCVTCGMDVSC